MDSPSNQPAQFERNSDMTREDQATTKRPVTAQIKAAPDAHAITDGEIVLATSDLPATPERVFRALTTDEAER